MPAELESTTELPPKPFRPPFDVEVAPAMVPELVAPELVAPELVAPELAAAPLLPPLPPSAACSGGAWSVQATPNVQANPIAEARTLGAPLRCFLIRVPTLRR